MLKLGAEIMFFGASVAIVDKLRIIILMNHEQNAEYFGLEAGFFVSGGAPVRERVFLLQLENSPGSADVTLLDGLPEERRLWGLMKHAAVHGNAESLRKYLKRFLSAREHTYTFRLRAVRSSADLYLLTFEIIDYAEMRHIVFELTPERIEADKHTKEMIAAVAIAAGFAGDYEGVTEIEPWIYTLGVDPAVFVLASTLLERPRFAISELFERIIESEPDAYQRIWYSMLAERTGTPVPQGYKWGPLFRIESGGWRKNIMVEDDFAFFKIDKLVRSQNGDF